MNQPSAATVSGQSSENPQMRVADAVKVARSAQQWWAAQSVKQRVRVLRRYRDVLIDNVDEIVETVGRETGKPRLDTINEVMQAATLIGFLAKQGPRYLKPRRVGSGLLVHKKSRIYYEPMGVIGVITPWNYPVLLVLSPILQALTAGNSVVLKPSEYATEAARLLHRLFAELSLPHPVFQCLPGGPETSAALAASAVDKIAFTGGTRGGRAVLRAAAENLTPVLLELGGSDAMIVAKDADLRRAARAAVWGAFLNAGQSCIAVERCYVDQTVADEFQKLVVNDAQSLKQGVWADAPQDKDFDLSALVTPAQFERVAETLRDARDKGALFLTGGVPETPADLNQLRNRCFPPTVLANVDHSMRVMTEETFGPLLPIMKVADAAEGLRLANETTFGLGGSIWTGDKKTGLKLAQSLRTGGVAVNDCLVQFAVNELPFGGVGQSGFGRTHGREGLYEYCCIKSIVEHRFGPKYEIQWFPYGSKFQWMKRALRLLFRSGLNRFR